MTRANACESNAIRKGDAPQPGPPHQRQLESETTSVMKAFSAMLNGEAGALDARYGDAKAQSCDVIDCHMTSASPERSAAVRLANRV